MAFPILANSGLAKSFFAHEPLAKERLKVDSDNALDIACKEPLLEKLTLKASRLVLERRSLEDSSPVWKVRLWAAKLKNPTRIE